MERTARSSSARIDVDTEGVRHDEVLGQEPQDIVARAAGVGHERLARSRFDIFLTGIIGGIEVSLGALAAMAVVGAALEMRLPLYPALAVGGLVFPVGFLFVILGRSELFTENFLIPVVAVFARERRVVSLLRTWTLSLVGNLIGCTLLAALVSVPHAVGDTLMHGYSAYTGYKLDVPNAGTFVSALLAGLTMTVLTWLLLSVRHPVAKIIAIWSAGYLLFATNVSHAIVGSSVLFAGWAPSHHSLLSVARWLGLAIAGNLLGGIGGVTLFRLVQAWEKQRRS